MKDQEKVIQQLLSSQDDTKKLYYENGNYSLERQKIQEQIKQQLMNDVQVPRSQPAVIFLGGGSASGKTSISRMLIQSFKDNQEDVLHIDPDKIKTMLPEYKKLVDIDPENMAVKLHNESSDVATDLFREALKKNLNIVLDGTMKDLNKYQRFIKLAREHDYGVSAVIADVPLEEALRRANVRFEIENRRVPEDVIRLSHQQVPLTFKKIEPLLDSFYLYDTSNLHPQQFYVKYDGQILVKNEERLAQFYNKADPQPENTPIRDQLKDASINYVGRGKPVNLGRDHNLER